MPLRVLVLHGPNLNLVTDSGRALQALDVALVARAAALDAEVKVYQSNAEGGLIDALQGHRDWCDAVIVNPAALAPLAFALAETLAMLKKPAVEVQLRPEVAGRGRSALKAVVDKQFHGHGFDGYLRALEALVQQLKAGAPSKSATRVREPGAKGAADRAANAAKQRTKTIGRKAPVTPGAASAASPVKTIGPRAEPQVSPSAPGAISRSTVRARLAERLGGQLSSEDFVAWARECYQVLRAGAAVEGGQRELLEDVLMLLAASSRAPDEALLATMARLDQ
jgi:3-dehydroquinate dehydratase-2